MAKSILEILLDSIFDDNWKGKYGEILTERELRFVQLFGRKGVKTQIISGDFRRLFQTETPVTVCG